MSVYPKWQGKEAGLKLIYTNQRNLKDPLMLCTLIYGILSLCSQALSLKPKNCEKAYAFSQFFTFTEFCLKSYPRAYLQRKTSRTHPKILCYV